MHSEYLVLNIQDQTISVSDWRRNCNTLSQKNVPLGIVHYLRQILTDFQNSFTGTLCGQLAIK